MRTTKILSSIVISFSISACFNVFSTEKDNLADTVKINNILTLKPTDNKNFLVAMNDYKPYCSQCGTRDHTTENCDEDSDVSFELSDDDNDGNSTDGTDYLDVIDTDEEYCSDSSRVSR